VTIPFSLTRRPGNFWRARIATSVRTPALLLFPLVVYLALPSRNFYWDGVMFAILIERKLPAAALAHPNHFIYTLWGSWLYNLSAWIGWPIRALYLMQIANCLLAGLAVMLLYRCLRNAGWSSEHGLMAALTFGFSAEWWKFATDVDAYIPAIFLLLCVYLLLGHPRMTLLAALTHAAATLFHELAILFLPVALLLLWRRRRSTMTGLTEIAAYCLAAFAPLAIAYVWAYRSMFPGGNPGLFGWIMTRSPGAVFAFNPFSDVGYTLRGTLRLFFGGRVDALVRNPLTAAACVLLACAVLAFLFYARRAMPATLPLTLPPGGLLLWAGVYAAFLFFWMPQNTFYRLFYLAPLILVVAMVLPDVSAVHRAGFWFAGVLFLWNFVFLTYPESRPEFNAPLHFALAQHDAWPSGTTIVFQRFHPDLWTISYFNPQAEWKELNRADLGQLDRDLAQARSRKEPLWLEETEYELLTADLAGRQWLSDHERPDRLVRFKDEKHAFVFHCIL
jgi:hypothetical protein